MKKALLAVISAGVVASMASLAFADDDAAYSANAVGVVKYTIPARGGMTCVSLPLNPMNQEGAWYWPDTSVAKNLPGGSIAYFWNPQTAGWDFSTKGLRDGQWAELNNTNLMMIAAGQAFFLRGPSSKTTNIVVSLLGELPTEGTLPVDVTGANNLDMRGISMYPVEVVFTNTAYAQQLPGGSMVYFWDGTQWRFSTKNVRDKTWSTVEGKETLFVGEGVFVRKAGSGMVIEETRPFDWE
jgi:hypothetical protein